MRAFNCIVRPAGQLTHEVPRNKISAKEVVLLRHIHGRDAIRDIYSVGEIKNYSEKDDYQNMAFNYGAPVVHRVFNVYVEPFDDPEVDPKDIIKDFTIIEAEAMAVNDVAQIVQEAGAKSDGPDGVDIEPTYTGDQNSQAVAKDIKAGLE